MPNQVTIRTSVKDDASKPLTSLHDAWKRFQADGAKGIAIGAGAAVTATALGMVENAVSAVTGAMADTIKKGLDEERSLAQLNTALQANVAGWDGNTAAIEAAIKARTDLGFSDVEQRDSLTRLVAATHDVNTALEIERTAMDLARFKGISLADATDALTKVEAGSYRILKSLGIELKKGATQTEALTAVQKVASGQAAEYASTTQGKLLVAQVKLDDALGHLGERALPLVASAADFAAAAFDNIIPIADTLGNAAHTVADALNFLSGSAHHAADDVDWLGSKTDPLGKAIHDFAGYVGDAITGTNSWDRALLGTASAQQSVTANADAAAKKTADLSMAQSAAAVVWTQSADGMASDARESGHVIARSALDAAGSVAGAAGKIKGDSGLIQIAFSGMGKSAHDAQISIKNSLSSIVANIQGTRGELQSAAQAAAAAIYDPIIAAANLAVTARSIAAEKIIIADKKSTAAQIAGAQLALVQLKQTQIQQLADLASYGDKSAQAALAHQLAILKSTKTLTVEQIAEIGLLEKALGGLKTAYGVAQSAAARLASVRLDNAYARAHPGAPIPHAAGGRYDAGVPRLVGEQGPEIDVPDHSGYIIPNNQISSGSGGSPIGGTTVIVNIPTTINGIPSPGQVLAWARDAAPALARELQRMKLIPA